MDIIYQQSGVLETDTQEALVLLFGHDKTLISHY